MNALDVRRTNRTLCRFWCPGVLALKILAAFLLNAGFLNAASLSEYKQRVESARFGVEELLDNSSNLGERKKIVAEILSDVPASEKIEWPGGSIETENGWIASKFKEFSDRRDPKLQRGILVEISERLLAISEAAGDLDKTVTSDRSKDQDKQKLAEILARQEYQKIEAKQESLFQKWWREFLEWLAKAFPRPEVEPGTSTSVGSLQSGLQVLIFVVVIGFVIFLLYRFSPFLAGRFGRRSKVKKEDRVILGERIRADESAADLFFEAEQLARDGNLRAAIRKGYIALLCDLSDRKIVRLARHKTNRDYLRDVRKNEILFENMSGLTFNFETNWYGLRTAEQVDWENFRNTYKQSIAAARSAR